MPSKQMAQTGQEGERVGQSIRSGPSRSWRRTQNFEKLSLESQASIPMCLSGDLQRILRVVNPEVR